MTATLDTVYATTADATTRGARGPGSRRAATGARQLGAATTAGRDHASATHVSGAARQPSPVMAPGNASLLPMIERYSLTSLDDIPAIFGVELPAGPPRFNIAPLQLAPICTDNGLVTARWGLLPPWRGHGGKRGPHILHAPLDTVDSTPVLRNAFTSQRCLVLADGYFLWHRGGRKPQPMWLHPTADPARPGTRSRIIAFAGVAATHRDDGQPSFAILLGPASPLVAPLAPTMPIVIPPDGYAAWRSGPRDRAVALTTAPPVGWRVDPVSTWVNSVDHDDPRCVEPLGNPAQGELF